jgi:hypothetical protein
MEMARAPSGRLFLLERVANRRTPRRHWEKTLEMARTPRDREPVDFPVLQQIASVCEQNVSRFGSPSGVHQFVNEMHQFVTMATKKTAPRQPKSGSGT